MIKKVSNITFHENPYGGAELIHTDRQTYDKLIGALYIFKNAPKRR